MLELRTVCFVCLQSTWSCYSRGSHWCSMMVMRRLKIWEKEKEHLHLPKVFLGSEQMTREDVWSSSRIVKAAPTETRTTITDEQALEQRWRPGQVWSSDLVTSEFLWSCLLSAVRHTLGPGLNIWTRELGFLFVFVGSLNNEIKLQLHQPVESVFWQSREQCCVVVSCGGLLGPALSMCPRKNSRIIQSAWAAVVVFFPRRCCQVSHRRLLVLVWIFCFFLPVVSEKQTPVSVQQHFAAWWLPKAVPILTVHIWCLTCVGACMHRCVCVWDLKVAQNCPCSLFSLNAVSMWGYL